MSAVAPKPFTAPEPPPDELMLPVFEAAQVETPIQTFDILTASIPKHLKISDMMFSDFLAEPDQVAQFIFKVKFDEFQKVAITIGVWTPFVMDSSGYSSSKTFRMWCVCVLRCLFIEDHESLVAYPTFSTGQKTFWEYFGKTAARSNFFRAHCGKAVMVGIDAQTGANRKAQLKGQSCWEFQFLNKSKVMLPAVGFLQDARAIASLRINDLFIDEHTKAEATGSTGIDDQLIGRATKEEFNQHHPFWCNHHYFAATAEDTMHPSFQRYKSYLDEVKKGNPDYALMSFCYKDFSDLPSGE